MATSSKFDKSSGSPDRPVYNSGLRGSHLVAQLDRSASFRESMECPALSPLPNMTRSSAPVAQGDVMNFLQCLRFDPKNVAADHKASRQGDFRRHLNSALNISVDDPPSVSSKGKVPQTLIPEEVKRVRVNLRECSVKARERMKIFSEALSVFNKFFPSAPSKKRSRSESMSSDRSNTLLSSERSVMGQSLGKMGLQNHGVTSSFEAEQQKSQDRIKSVVPNKRTRTSLVDVRSNALLRTPGTADKDREAPKLATNGTVQVDERTLPVGVDGWEKTKMKKKRSGIKPAVSSASVSTKPCDLYRDPKQGLQQRAVSDGRSRLNGDGHGFRSGVTNAGTVGKSDGVSQLPGVGVRSSIPRTDLENGSVLNDRRERPVSSDKERANIRSVNKSNVRDDSNSGSPTSGTKVNPSIRAPRSGSGAAPKLSPVVHRATVSNDWEISHCSNKPPAVGANHRKRTASNRSSSPPVAQWAGQRPQKISRTARRTNLMPIVSSNDEGSAVDTVSDVSVSETGKGHPRRLSGSSAQQVKLKSEPLSSAALSESEESGAPEIKSKVKPKRSDEVYETSGVQKVSSLGMPSRKNKQMVGEDMGDGVRRQGRTGRTFSSTRSPLPMGMEKVGIVGPVKQIRSARASSDKNESKLGRPPTRKLSDRKAYTRQKQTVVNATIDCPGGSIDGHEELPTAASAAISHSSQVLSSSFWRQVEQFFGNIADVDLDYLKQPENLEPVSSLPVLISSNADKFSNIYIGSGLIEQEREVDCVTEENCYELHLGQSMPGTGSSPLCQMLLAAIISEEDCRHVDEDNEFGAYETGFELEGVLDLSGFEHLDNFQTSTHAAYNEYNVETKQGHDSPEINVLSVPKACTYSNSIHSANGGISDLTPVSLAASDFQYDYMHLHEKLLLEVQSIGIFPESVPSMHSEDNAITVDICKLEEKHTEQMLKKKGLLGSLLKAAVETKEIQQKEFEHRAYDKLTTMAYQKYMACCGSTGGKNSNNKMVKQATLVFVKRTLEQCHNFEGVGKGCFSQPMFTEMFLSGSSHGTGPQIVDSESARQLAGASSGMLDSRVSDSTTLQPSPRTLEVCQNGDEYGVNSPVNHGYGKEAAWSNRVKKRELLLEEVGIGTSAGGSLSNGIKGKRSEREREGKGHNREISSRNGTNRSGRPAVSNTRGERKSKTKPKQKTTQSVSVNGLVGKIEHPKPTVPSEPKLSQKTNSSANNKDGFGLDVLGDPESLDFASLLPGIGDDEQGHDLGSWLNIDDDGLQDDDFMGLGIPMDDISDLNMMV
ncbi:hypothetical protein LINGRAHAP2_LOCUS2527 [Linum grandiflorum]